MGTTPDVPGAPQTCSLFHWREMCGWKGSKNQDSLPLQLFYYMSQSGRVFHLNSEFLMNGQTSCKPSRPDSLISPTVHFLDRLPHFRRLWLACLVWSCQRGIECALWASQMPVCNVRPEAGLSLSSF